MPKKIRKESVVDSDFSPLEHIIKFEAEVFADSVILKRTEETIDCNLDVGPKALDQ